MCEESGSVIDDAVLPPKIIKMLFLQLKVQILKRKNAEIKVK